MNECGDSASVAPTHINAIARFALPNPCTSIYMMIRILCERPHPSTPVDMCVWIQCGLATPGAGAALGIEKRKEAPSLQTNRQHIFMSCRGKLYEHSIYLCASNGSRRSYHQSWRRELTYCEKPFKCGPDHVDAAHFLFGAANRVANFIYTWHTCEERVCTHSERA